MEVVYNNSSFFFYTLTWDHKMSTRKQRHWRTLSYMAENGYELKEIVYNEVVRIPHERIKKAENGFGWIFFESQNHWTELPYEKSWENDGLAMRPCFRFVTSEGKELAIRTWEKMGEFVNLHQRYPMMAERLFDAFWIEEEQKA